MEPKSCCSIFISNAGGLSIFPNCTGTSKTWLDSQIARIIRQRDEQPFPFVLKNQQSFGGGGTFAVPNSEELSEPKLKVSNQVLPKLFSQVNASNAHVKPVTLVLSHVVEAPIGDWGLAIFVTKLGKCVFIAVTKQVVDSSKAWIGSTASYQAQEKLKHKFTPVMHTFGAWLQSYGYFGTCEAEILEAAPEKDCDVEAPILNIVDFNVRTSGSLVLGLMKGHSSDRWGLHEASSFSVSVKMTREAFIAHFETQFREGRMVLTPYYEDIESGLSYGNVIIEAEDQEGLERQAARVRYLAPEVHV